MDHTYHFSGVVHPERVEMSLPQDFKAIECRNTDGDEYGLLDLRIVYSQISAVFKTSREVEDVSAVRDALQEVISTLVDSLGYYQVCGYTVELRHASYEGKQDRKTTHWFFTGEVEKLQRRYEPTDREMVMEDIARLHSFACDLFLLARGNAGLCIRLCLADLRMALLTNTQTPFYCYRAVEALKQHYSVTSDKEHRENKLWSEFWLFIGDDGSSEHFVKDTLRPKATPIRHGKLPCESFDRPAVLKETWDVVDKYIAACNARNSQQNTQ